MNCLIIEVLSPSTAAYDRGDKFTMYRRNSVLQDYVLASADRMSIALGASEAIDLFHKDEQGKWEILNYRAGDAVELRSILVSRSKRFIKKLFLNQLRKITNRISNNPR
jgi:Uma2 family endonuclease